jgi:hypothetical protein
MDQELADLRELVEENNRILHKLLAHQRYATMVSVLKWGLIIGTAFGTYYLLQPYIDQVIKIYTSVDQSLGPILNPGRSLLESGNGQR